MKKKRIIVFIFAAVVIIVSAAFGFNAFGNDTDWSYDENTKTLYITGTGDMEDYPDVYSTPWSSRVLSVERLVIEDGVASVGNNILSGAVNLEEVSIANTVTSIGANAFASCSKLTELDLSDNISYIADVSFAKMGADDKAGFKVKCNVGSYALGYTIVNEIPYETQEVKCGEKDVILHKGMSAYYPYTPKISGTYKFYSVSLDDTEGYVFDSSLNQIAYNDDRSASNIFSPKMSGVDFALTVNLTAGNTYYFATKVINPTITASYKAYILPHSFEVTGRIYATKNKKGELSNLVLTDALMNGEATNGEYTFTFSENSNSAEFSCGNMTVTHEFNPDDESQDIGIMVCDANGDKVVNGKDYRILKKNNSPYTQFFGGLAGYRY